MIKILCALIAINSLSTLPAMAQFGGGSKAQFLCVNGIPFAHNLSAMRSGITNWFKVSPREDGLIVAGDRIISANGTPIGKDSELRNILRRTMPLINRELKVKVKGSYDIIREVKFRFERSEQCSLKEADRIIAVKARKSGISASELKLLVALVEKKNFAQSKPRYNQYESAQNNPKPTRNRRWAINTTSDGAPKKNLILLPINLPTHFEASRSVFEQAIAHTLGGRYNVFSGRQVREKLEVEFQKEDCTVETCIQNLAVEFNGELVADIRLNTVGNATAIGFQVNNVISGEIETSSFDLCNNCSTEDLVAYFIQ